MLGNKEPELERNSRKKRSSILRIAEIHQKKFLPSTPTERENMKQVLFNEIAPQSAESIQIIARLGKSPDTSPPPNMGFASYSKYAPTNRT